MKTEQVSKNKRIMGLTFLQVSILAILSCLALVLISVFSWAILNNPSFRTISPVSSATIFSQTQSADVTKAIKPTSTIISPTQTNTPHPSPTEIIWKSHIIELYSLSVDIPQNWIVQKINRRPEPNNPGDTIKGHDCAEYQISTFDNLLALSIIPTCGFSEGFPGTYPAGFIVINPNNKDNLLGRFYDGKKYIYSNAFTYSYTDTTGSHQELVTWEPPTIILHGKQDFIAIGVTFQYPGSQEQLEQTLSIIDKIILSIRRL